MGVWELLVLAVGVSMDAMAVSICKGLAMKKATLKNAMTCDDPYSQRLSGTPLLF